LRDVALCLAIAQCHERGAPTVLQPED
jgi:hypothetical protein